MVGDKDRVRILIADDHEIVCEGLRRLLETEEGFTVVGIVHSGRAAIEEATKLAMDVVVMDVKMPEVNGVEATRALREACPKSRVVGLSFHTEYHIVSDMLSAGAVGYVQKGSSPKLLIQAIKAAADSRGYLDPVTSNVLIDRKARFPSAGMPRNVSALTPRELEVLELLAEGLSPREAAGKLRLSVYTVHTHRRHIMEKLNIRNVVHLVRYALREGLSSV